MIVCQPEEGFGQNVNRAFNYGFVCLELYEQDICNVSNKPAVHGDLRADITAHWQSPNAASTGVSLGIPSQSECRFPATPPACVMSGR